MLRSPQELIGAAISLGALDVGSLSKGELQLLKGADEVRLSPTATARLRRAVREGSDAFRPKQRSAYSRSPAASRASLWSR
jgi:hypothetical protein